MEGENGYDRVDPWKELDNDYSHRCPDYVKFEVPDNIYKNKIDVKSET